MPTSRRSCARAAPLGSPSPGRPTAWPHTVIVPAWMVSSPAMQRSNVLLPEPLRPTIATVWPGATSKPTPSSTRNGANSLTTAERWTIASGLGASGTDMDLPLERPRGDRQGVAQREIDRGDDAEDHERLEGRVVDDLARARELDESDHRGERGVLDDLDHEADGRRDGE